MNGGARLGEGEVSGLPPSQLTPTGFHAAANGRSVVKRGGAWAWFCWSARQPRLGQPSQWSCCGGTEAPRVLLPSPESSPRHARPQVLGSWGALPPPAASRCVAVSLCRLVGVVMCGVEGQGAMCLWGSSPPSPPPQPSPLTLLCHSRHNRECVLCCVRHNISSAHTFAHIGKPF